MEIRISKDTIKNVNYNLETIFVLHDRSDDYMHSPHYTVIIRLVTDQWYYNII